MIWQNQDVEPLLTKMKTKTIVLIALFLLSWLATSSYSCICEQSTDARSQISFGYAEQQDLCPDCGHSSNCCSIQNSVAIAGETAGVWISGDCDCVEIVRVKALQSVQPRDVVAWSNGNRAPPPRKTETPVSLHQLLLV